MNICCWYKKNNLWSKTFKDLAVDETPSNIFFCHGFGVTAIVFGHQNHLQTLENLHMVIIAKIWNENKWARTGIKVKELPWKVLPIARPRPKSQEHHLGRECIVYSLDFLKLKIHGLLYCRYSGNIGITIQISDCLRTYISSLADLRTISIFIGPR